MLCGPLTLLAPRAGPRSDAGAPIGDDVPLVEASQRTYEQVRMPGGWVAARPLPSAEELARFYADDYYQRLESSTYQSSYDDEELAHKRLRVAVALHAIAAAGADPSHGPMLELGAGEGFFLAGAAEAGWDVRGVDLSSFAVERFNPSVAGRVRHGDAESALDDLVAQRERVAVCVLVNVLEHVRDPEALLGRVEQVLTPQGLVVITVPNDDSPLQHTLRRRGHVEDDPWFVPPQHLSYFNTDTGPALARSCGYDVVDLFSDFPIDWYLLHPGANYVADPAQGKAAHRARITVELLLAERGLERFHALGQALAACGAGRDFTMVLRRPGGG